MIFIKKASMTCFSSGELVHVGHALGHLGTCRWRSTPHVIIRGPEHNQQVHHVAGLQGIHPMSCAHSVFFLRWCQWLNKLTQKLPTGGWAPGHGARLPRLTQKLPIDSDSCPLTQGRPSSQPNSRVGAALPAGSRVWLPCSLLSRRGSSGAAEACLPMDQGAVGPCLPEAMGRRADCRR
jgi:hypothetical protein